MPWLLALVAVALAAGCAWAVAFPSRAPLQVGLLVEDLTGANPRPVHLLTPPQAPLSALASLGRQLFHDPALSASGRQSCASCHDPAHAYASPGEGPVESGGPQLRDAGFRPPPSLTYLYRQAPFSIGPDVTDSDTAVNLNDVARQARGVTRARKTAGSSPAAPAIVPQGGLFWDGRADTLQDQAMGPLLNPVEMANADVAQVAGKLDRPGYHEQFQRLFGTNVFRSPSLLVAEAMSAISRYQIEDTSFHRFDSKYDRWLEGKVRLNAAELRGLRLFEDPDKANCAGCHLSRPSPEGLPPLFTDGQYEALGVPRNPALPANRDPKFVDLGLCGPFRTDLATQTQYCGMFLTPTLRNASTRHAYFHNGVYRTLKQVMDFYNWRDVHPDRIYPHDGTGQVMKFDDLPARFHGNIDTRDAPLDRRPGEAAPMSDQDIDDIIAFLKTLDDGYPIH